MKDDDTLDCPVCEQRHTDKEEPTIGDVLGPCADEWFADALKGTGWENSVDTPGGMDGFKK